MKYYITILHFTHTRARPSKDKFLTPSLIHCLRTLPEKNPKSTRERWRERFLHIPLVTHTREVRMAFPKVNALTPLCYPRPITTVYVGIYNKGCKSKCT